MQVDVIESNYAILEQSVSAAQDFHEAERAHDRYLHRLITQSFLSHGSLCKDLSEVFGHVRELCGVISRARDTGVDWKKVQVCAQKGNMPGTVGGFLVV